MAVTRRTRDGGWTPEQQAEHAAIRARFADGGPDLDDLVAEGDVDPASIATLGEKADALRAASLLRRAREAAGLSLSEVSERSGIERSALERKGGQAPRSTGRASPLFFRVRL